MDLYSIAFRLHPLQVSDWTVVVAGISIVVGTLLLLIVVFNIFGSFISKAEQKAKKKAMKKVEAPIIQTNPPIVSQNVSPVMPPVVEQGISGEIVAAISAAVYSVEGEGATIKSITPIRKQNPITGRNPWAQAAVMDNTRPF